MNKAVSFNAIKNRVFEIFAEQEDLDTTLEELTQFFLTYPVLIRKQRAPERKKASGEVIIIKNGSENLFLSPL